MFSQTLSFIETPDSNVSWHKIFRIGDVI